MDNIIFANFECNETTKVVSQKAWQYGYGQVLKIQGLNLPSAVEIHFSLQETGGEAVRRIGITKSGVTDVVIPDFILEGNDSTRNYNAFAFIYLSDEESGQTTHKIQMQIKSRPKPEGSTGTDETSFAAIMAAVNEIANSKADGLECENSILKLLSGETELARVTITGGSGGTSREIELQKSDTAIQWRYVGDEEWTDLVLLEELKGDPGEGVSNEKIQEAVNAYMEANPVEGANVTAEKISEVLGYTPAKETDVSQLQDTISDKATLENGVIKFYKTGETDKLLFSVDVSSIGGTGGLDLNNLVLSVSQVGEYQRLSMSDGTTTKTVDIPITTITDEQVQTAVETWLNEHPEATTTVAEGGIEEKHLSDDVKEQINQKADNISVDDKIDLIVHGERNVKLNWLEGYAVSAGKPYVVSGDYNACNICSQDFIYGVDNAILTIQNNNSSDMKVWRYKNDGTYVDLLTSFSDIKKIITLETGYKYRISIFKVSGINGDIVSLNISFLLDLNLYDSNNVLKNKFQNATFNEFINVQIYTGGGLLTTGKIVSYETGAYTDKIPCTENEEYHIVAESGGALADTVIFKNDEVLEYYQDTSENANLELIRRTVVIPSGATHIRFGTSKLSAGFIVTKTLGKGIGAIHQLTNELKDFKTEVDNSHISWIPSGSVGIIGDSISTFDKYGYKIDGYAMAYPNNLPDANITDVNETWWKKVFNSSGCVIDINASCSVSRVTDTNDYPSLCDRTSLLNNPDTIFVALGTNDSNGDVELGEYEYDVNVSELDTTKFRPAYIKGIKQLMANYPNAKIILFALKMNSAYSESIREIAEYYGFDFVSVQTYSRPTGDGVHPNKVGMHEIAYEILNHKVNKKFEDIVNRIEALETNV